MSNEIFRSLYNKLLLGPIPVKKVGKTIQESSLFEQLLLSGIIEKKRQGRGFVFTIVNQEAYQNFLTTNFPGGGEGFEDGTGFQNVLQYRDSKGRRRLTKNIVFLRGWKELYVNEKKVNLGFHTAHFKLFSAQIHDLVVDKLCYVENLEPFLYAEEIWNKDWIFFHSYGRVGLSILNHLRLKELLICVDYDYDGLEEFLRIKEIHPNAEIYIPDNFENLHEKFAKNLPKGSMVKKRTKLSTLDPVIRIRKILEKTNKFLEQEALWYDLKSGSR